MTITIFYRCHHAGKLQTCQQKFAQLHHDVLKRRGYRDVGSVATLLSHKSTRFLDKKKH